MSLRSGMVSDQRITTFCSSMLSFLAGSETSLSDAIPDTPPIAPATAPTRAPLPTSLRLQLSPLAFFYNGFVIAPDTAPLILIPALANLIPALEANLILWKHQGLLDLPLLHQQQKTQVIAPPIAPITTSVTH